MFLLTDAQVPEEEFLVVINDLLASGEVPDLFPDDEVENIINSLRNEVKGAGLQDTNENCWKFMMDRVKKQLKVVCRSCSLVAGSWKCTGAKEWTSRHVPLTVLQDYVIHSCGRVV